jgi:hypothetical protein
MQKLEHQPRNLTLRLKAESEAGSADTALQAGLKPGQRHFLQRYAGNADIERLHGSLEMPICAPNQLQASAKRGPVGGIREAAVLPVEISQPSDRSERQANRIADRVSAGLKPGEPIEPLGTEGLHRDSGMTTHKSMSIALGYTNAFGWTPADFPKLEEVQKLVEVVRNDPECINRITSPLRFLPAGMAGWTRDARVMGSDIVTGKDPTPEKQKFICNGIDEGAQEAIGKAKLAFVKTVGTADRQGGYFREAGVIVGSHVATRVDFADGHTVVFDWWATMDINDPLLFPSTRDFEGNKRAMRFSQWVVPERDSTSTPADPTAKVQRYADDHPESSGVPASVPEALRSPGRPLDANSLDYMESRFGKDFSRVRIHTDAQAGESARAVNARAYTVMGDVVFGTGQYQPQTTEGKRLIAHELTHVLQQSANRGSISDRFANSCCEHQTVIERASEPPATTALTEPSAQAFDCERESLASIKSLFALIILGGRSHGYHEAAKSLENFLSQEEDVLEFPASFLLKVPQVIEERRKFMARNVDTAFALAAAESQVSRVTDGVFHLAPPNTVPINPFYTPAVLYTLGRFVLSMAADFMLSKEKKSNGECSRFIVYVRNTFSVVEKIDWHPGHKVNIPYVGDVDDLCGQRLVNAGLGKEFRVEIKWVEAQSFVIECIEGGGFSIDGAEQERAKPPLPENTGPSTTPRQSGEKDPSTMLPPSQSGLIQRQCADGENRQQAVLRRSSAENQIGGTGSQQARAVAVQMTRLPSYAIQRQEISEENAVSKKKDLTLIEDLQVKIAEGKGSKQVLEPKDLPWVKSNKKGSQTPMGMLANGLLAAGVKYDFGKGGLEGLSVGGITQVLKLFKKLFGSQSLDIPGVIEIYKAIDPDEALRLQNREREIEKWQSWLQPPEERKREEEWTKEEVVRRASRQLNLGGSSER